MGEKQSACLGGESAIRALCCNAEQMWHLGVTAYVKARGWVVCGGGDCKHPSRRPSIFLFLKQVKLLHSLDFLKGGW